MFYWKLDRQTLRLIWKIFDEQGIIFVDYNGLVYEIDKGGSKVVDSSIYDNLGQFIDAIQITRMRLYLKYND